MKCELDKTSSPDFRLIYDKFNDVDVFFVANLWLILSFECYVINVINSQVSFCFRFNVLYGFLMKLESSMKSEYKAKADMLHVLSKLVTIQWNNL